MISLLIYLIGIVICFFLITALRYVFEKIGLSEWLNGSFCGIAAMFFMQVIKILIQ